MSLRLLPVTLCVACLLLVAADAPEGWTSYPSKSGGFQIDFPEKPKEEKEVISGVDGGGDVDQIQYLVGGANGAYLASFQPAPRLAKSDAKTMSAALDKAAARLAATFEGRVLSAQAVQLGKAAGTEVVVDCPKIKGRIRSRMFLTNGRFYQVMLIGAPDFIATKEADHFLGSFRITK